MLGRGLGCEVGVHVCVGALCMAEGGEMVYTINKCLGDLLSSAKEVQEWAHTHLHFLC